MQLSVVLLLTLSQLAAQGAADIYLYGARHEVPHYGYGYVGLDWLEEYATCSGSRQSPINVPGHAAFLQITDGDETRLNYGQLASNGSNIKVVNNGHTVQVVAPGDYAPPASVVVRGNPENVTLVTKFRSTAGPAQRVKITPTQFHFHTRGEHVIDGKEYLMELHIVNWVYNTTLPGCGAAGCATVVAIMFELADDNDKQDNKTAEFLDAVWNVMPSNEGESAFIPEGTTLDFDAILPKDRSYVTYEGSLTTPPCTEGILWHVMTTAMKITPEQLHQFELAVGMTNCTHERDQTFSIMGMNGTNSSADSNLTSGNGTLHDTAATKLDGSTTEDDINATSKEQGSEVPEFEPDALDGLLCRKLSGQNYREVQDRDARPLWFYPAAGVCEPTVLQAGLKKLGDLSKALQRLVFEANSTDGITLHQYQDMVTAGLTKSAGCGGAGTSTSAAAAKGGWSVLVQAALSALVLCWFLLGM